MMRISPCRPCDEGLIPWRKSLFVEELLTQPLVLPLLELDELGNWALAGTAGLAAGAILSGRGSAGDNEAGNDGDDEKDPTHEETPAWGVRRTGGGRGSLEGTMLSEGPE